LPRPASFPLPIHREETILGLASDDNVIIELGQAKAFAGRLWTLTDVEARRADDFAALANGSILRPCLVGPAGSHLHAEKTGNCESQKTRAEHG
jgi:hypothetical protein